MCAAIRGGADLRIYTEFIHNQHIDPASASDELIREVSEFRATYLVEDRWCAGIMTLRQPISLPDEFGPRASMSFFMYNQDGQQAIARPDLDSMPRFSGHGGPMGGTMGHRRWTIGSAYPKYHQQDGWDAGTNAPSSNFIYDFEVFRYFVAMTGRRCSPTMPPVACNPARLISWRAPFEAGTEIKVAIRNLCADLDVEPAQPIEHEVFIQAGPGYYYSGQRLFIAGTHPLVRVRPGIPMRYVSQGWDFGWLMPRTDGAGRDVALQSLYVAGATGATRPVSMPCAGLSARMGRLSVPCPRFARNVGDVALMPGIWTTRGFEAFRGGEISVTPERICTSPAPGMLQRIHCFDLNGDGYLGLPFCNSQEHWETPPAYVYRDPTGRDRAGGVAHRGRALRRRGGPQRGRL